MEEQDTIDLGQVWHIAQKNRKKLLSIVALFVVAAIILSLILPEKFESSVLVRAKNQKQGGISLQATAALALLGGSTAAPLQSYQELIKSRSVLDPVIKKMDLPNKDKITNVTFAKSYLKLANPKGTDLLQITATGRSPEEAQLIAASVVGSFQQVLTKLNQSEQSLQMKFLSERIAVAKQEMEQAENELEKFRQQTKMYIPEEQTKTVVLALADFDQKLAQLQVEDATSRAKLQGVDAQLKQQNLAMEKFNIAENEVMDKIRTTIIDKQMKLVALQQRYQDKHPEVILAKEELAELKATLNQEISKAVQSGANILNPVQGALLAEKVSLETTLIANQAREEAMRQVQAKAEQNLSSLSERGLTYVGLYRQTRVTQEVYSVLVKNYEQARIQETMESMDIQVVDEANLPIQRSAPRRTLVVAIGGVVGMMAALAYLLVVYIREPKKPLVI